MINNKSKILNVNTDTKDDYKYAFRSPSKYLRHPLAWNMQAQFIFTIGEVQLEINKKTYN